MMRTAISTSLASVAAIFSRLSSRSATPIQSGSVSLLSSCTHLVHLRCNLIWGTQVEKTYSAVSSICSQQRVKGVNQLGTRFSQIAKSMDDNSISYISQADAAAIDELLMGPLGFSVDQLMELAGLSVASAIAEVYKPTRYSKVLVICGPGNNGGDGLVAARHLYHFGYRLFVCYPKRTNKPLYNGLTTQLEALGVPFLSAEELPTDFGAEFDIIVDAIFGFSFHGSPRPPFDYIIGKITAEAGKSTWKKFAAIVSVDIPSGWDVEHGDREGTGLKPDMLVSLTAPKLCAKSFTGPHHYLGGRFVPPEIANKYSFRLPRYQGTSMCVRIGKPSQVDVASLREDYATSGLFEENVNKDPIKQFQQWFEDALAAGLPEPNAMALATANKNAYTSGRMVLLKGFDEDGFVWYTNYQSRKAREILENPHASLLFFWEPLCRQVRIEGLVEKVSDEESDEYFHSRPRESQLGALASNQSSVIAGRDALHKGYKELQEKFPDGTIIPRPKHWGGFRLMPNTIEFWQGQPHRLHDRLVYMLIKVDGQKTWKIERLSP